jgi:ribosome-binding ATPase YchF (GTP1/OBG family)
VDEDSAINGNEFTKQIDEYAKKNNSEVLLVSAKIESEISQISDENEKKEFLESLGLSETGLKRVIRKDMRS